MPVEAEPGGGSQGRRLVDDGGAPLARFLAIERPHRAVADLLELEPGAPPERVAAVAMRDLGGWRVVAPLALADRLVAAGGTRHRHAHAMTRPLGDVPGAWGRAALPDVAVRPVDRPPEDLLAARFAAYPEGHVDHLPERDGRRVTALAELAGLMGGSHGSLLPASRIAVDARTGAVVGAALAGAQDDDLPPPLDGPWLLELFRAPGRRGTGALLLGHVLHALAEDGHAKLGLSVTEGNPARRLYERLGFATAYSGVAVDLPRAVAARR